MSEKITVVQMLPELDNGGVERGTLEIGKFLAEKNHRSLVISAGGRMVNRLEEEGSEHVAWAVGEKTPRCLSYFRPLRRLLLREKVDIFHLRSRLPAWLGYLVWQSLPAGQRPALITTFHGYYSVNGYSAVMTKGQSVIAVSQGIKNHIAENYGVKDRVRLIYRGVDNTVFQAKKVDGRRVDRLLREWKVKANVPVILFPGRLSRQKGHDLFLRSLLRVTGEYQAIIVGDYREDNRYVQELKKFTIANGLQGRVQMVGHCSDMPAALLLADLIVNAASTEPEAFGRTTIEAMAMEKPVIASAHGGSLETVVHGDTGWLFKPNDREELARRIDRALTNGEKLKEAGKKGRELVCRKFSLSAMCEKTLALYLEYASGGGLQR